MAADILLWRNKRKALATVLILIGFYFNFIVPEYTLITAVAKLMLLALIFLFVHGKLPGKILGYTVEKIPESKFHVTEETSHLVALSLVASWNSAVDSLKSLSKGNDLILFLKVALSLLALSYLGAMSLQSLFTRVLPFAFVAFYVYEQKEEEIDGFFLTLLSLGCMLKSEVEGKIFPSKKLGKSE